MAVDRVLQRALQLVEAGRVFHRKKLAQLESAPPTEAAPYAPRLYENEDWTLIPPRDVLYDQHIIRGVVTASVGLGGGGKTMTLILEAIAMATGKALLQGVMPKKPLKVFLWNGEDPEEELRRRIGAVRKFFNNLQIPLGNLVVETAQSMPICLAKLDKGGAVSTGQVWELVKFFKSHGIDVAIFDPMIAMHLCNENDNAQMELFMQQFLTLATHAKVAVHGVHHSVKGHGEVNQLSTRGGSAIINKTRAIRVFNGMTADEARDFGVPTAQAWLYFWNQKQKNNLSGGGSKLWHKFESVCLDNGTVDAEGIATPADVLGVPVLWNPERVACTEDLDEETVATILDAIREANPPFSPSIKAGDRWVGLEVARAANIHPESMKGKKSWQRHYVERHLRDWLASGLIEYTERRENGRAFKIVTAPTDTTVCSESL
jgi:hypothetical protein